MLRSRGIAWPLILGFALTACSGSAAVDSTSVPVTTVPTTAVTTVPTSPVTTSPPVTTTGAGPTTTTTVAEALWGPGTPEDVGMDSGDLADMVEHITNTSPGIDSVTVVRGGTVVLDAAFAPHDGSTLHSVYSVTKSVVSTLIGIAIESGFIAGVDVPVVELLPDHAPAEIDDLKALMTLEDVLTMSTGLDCRDSYLYRWQGLAEMRASEDWAAHVLSLPMRDEPGTRFEYCNGASHLLSTILTDVTGMPALQFAEEVLFGPLGIEEVVWLEGRDRISQGWAGISLRTEDMARIGRLYLQGGIWDGTRVLPDEWVSAATTRHIDAGTAADGYGYQWWVDDGYAAAIGYGGQYVLLIPEVDLVVAFVSGLTRNHALPVDLLHRYVLPSVRSDGSLPPDPEASGRLADAIAVAATVPPAVDLAVSPVAADLDGVPHAFDENAGGFEWFVLDFEDDAVTMALEDVDGPIEVTMAFDGRFHENEAWGSTWAFRPEWTDDDTLTIDFRVVGGAARGEFQFVIEDDVVHMWYREDVFATNVLATAPRQQPSLAVPTLPEPVIDGRFEDGEWDGAAVVGMDDGSVVRFVHAAGELFVAVDGEGGGSINVVIAEDDRVRFLHSSAALGSAEYVEADDGWRLTRDFDWCCRRSSPPGELEALLATEGWMANIAYTGPPGEVEFRVDWPGDGAAVAVSRVPSSVRPGFWPQWLGDDGREALWGPREEIEHFDVERWVVLSRDDG